MNVERLMVITPMLLLAVASPTVALLPRAAGARPVTWLLTTLTGLLAAVTVHATIHSLWMNIALAAIMGLPTAALWDTHLAIRHGRQSRYYRWTTRRVIRRRYGGRSIAWLRAEYGQTVLDDAEYDPVLSDLLDDYGRRITESMTEPGDDDRIVTQMDLLLAYGNGYVDSMSEPGRRPKDPVYRGYSTDMVVIAAVCRAAERLQVSAR